MALSSSPATAIKVMVSPWPLWQVLKRLQNEPSLRPQGRANVGFPRQDRVLNHGTHAHYSADSMINTSLTCSAE